MVFLLVLSESVDAARGLPGWMPQATWFFQA